VNALKCQKLECASCWARKFDPRPLEQLQWKQTPLIHCRNGLMENGDRPVTSTKIHSKNAESVEYALRCEIEHYFGEMQLEIFLYKHQCQILHYICRKRQLLGWLSCELVWMWGWEWDLWPGGGTDPLTFPLQLSEHHQLLHTGAESQTTMLYFSNSRPERLF